MLRHQMNEIMEKVAKDAKKEIILQIRVIGQRVWIVDGVETCGGGASRASGCEIRRICSVT